MFTEATHDDCAIIAALAAKTFTESFGHSYRPENLAQHLAEKCSKEFFEHSISAGNTVLMLHDANTLIGYAKIGHVALPVKPPIPKGAQEIHRVYIDKAFQGRGLGKAMMLHILSLPRIATAAMVYLGVWEENIRAQTLYKQYGFVPHGHYLYAVGDQYDKEMIMARVR